MWAALEESLNQNGVVEYGIFQRDRRPGSPIWRRHGIGGKRFETLSNALLNSQGARKACKGQAHYPRVQYAASSSSVLLVPYVATWLQRGTHAYLVRASAGDPEITIVPASEVSELNATTEEALCVALADAFGRGAMTYGIRALTAKGIQQMGSGSVRR